MLLSDALSRLDLFGETVEDKVWFYLDGPPCLTPRVGELPSTRWI